MREFPKYKYHPEKDPVVVDDEHEEKDLGAGWFNSPAEHGVETCPGKKPDASIAKNKKKAVIEKPSSEKSAPEAK